VLSIDLEGWHYKQLEGQQTLKQNPYYETKEKHKEARQVPRYPVSPANS
jgi:hypothetical protein